MLNLSWKGSNFACMHCQLFDSELVEIRATLVGVRSSCRSLIVLWLSYTDHLDSNFTTVSRAQAGYQVPMRRQQRGRPQFIISRDQLEYLRSMRFSWHQISNLLGVSRMTVYRRRRDFGILDFDEPARNMSDNELHRVLQQVRQEMPHMGEALVIGRLHSMGYRIPRQRVREAIHATDPLNTALRWGGILTTRRPYSVAGPNSLWHVGMFACEHVCICALKSFLLEILLRGTGQSEFPYFGAKMESFELSTRTPTVHDCMGSGFLDTCMSWCPLALHG